MNLLSSLDRASSSIWDATESLIELGLGYAATESSDHFIVYTTLDGAEWFELEDFSYLMRRRMGFAIPSGEPELDQLLTPASFQLVVNSEMSAKSVLQDTLLNCVGGATQDDTFEMKKGAEALKVFVSNLQNNRFSIVIHPEICHTPAFCIDPDDDKKRRMILPFRLPEGKLAPFPVPKIYADHYYFNVVDKIRSGSDLRAVNTPLLAMTNEMVLSFNLV